MLSLEDETSDAALEIDEFDISKENGVDFIIECLNRLLKKDSTVTKYHHDIQKTFKYVNTNLIK